MYKFIVIAPTDHGPVPGYHGNSAVDAYKAVEELRKTNPKAHVMFDGVMSASEYAQYERSMSLAKTY